MATKKTVKTRKVAVKKKAPAPAPARAGAKRTPKPAAAPKTKARAVVPTPLPKGAKAPRRIIFVDVENTSSEQALFEVIDSLQIDRRSQPTEIHAVGNWRAVGLHVGRRLGALGAQLVHSAPARGVRDWSDLWIAVAAGCWLGQAEPGDILDIVSNDRAFDAVGDAAAARGVVFHRVQHRRGGAGTPILEPTEPKAPRRRTRGGRRRRRSGPPTTAATALRPAAATSAPPAAAAAAHAAEPHGASRDQMIGVLGRLTNGEPGRWVNLDVLEKALKNEGFARPAGSPRLVTRLRMLKEVEVDAHGRVRLAAAGQPKAGD